MRQASEVEGMKALEKYQAEKVADKAKEIKEFQEQKPEVVKSYDEAKREELAAAKPKAEGMVEENAVTKNVSVRSDFGAATGQLSTTPETSPTREADFKPVPETMKVSAQSSGPSM